MIDITLENFETELIDGSHDHAGAAGLLGRLVRPLQAARPVLEKLEADYGGRFKLAKLDADQEPQISQQLSQMFGVRSIPVLRDVQGRPAGRRLRGRDARRQDPRLPRQACAAAPTRPQPPSRKKPRRKRWPKATPKARSTGCSTRSRPTRPTTTRASTTSSCCCRQGRVDDAKVAFAPVIAKTSLVRRFDALQRWMDAIDFAAPATGAAPTLADADARIAANKRDFDARFDRARLLMAQQRWTEAMDELLEILMRDKAWNEELARKTYIAILDIIEPPKPKVADGQIPPDDPTVATYRRRLSSVVLS